MKDPDMLASPVCSAVHGFNEKGRLSEDIHVLIEIENRWEKERIQQPNSTQTHKKKNKLTVGSQWPISRRYSQPTLLDQLVLLIMIPFWSSFQKCPIHPSPLTLKIYSKFISNQIIISKPKKLIHYKSLKKIIKSNQILFKKNLPLHRLIEWTNSAKLQKRNWRENSVSRIQLRKT